MIQKVVGIAFIEQKKLLISQSVKSAKNNKYTFVGGGIEEGETVRQAAVRECKEEIQNGFEITEQDFEELFYFVESAASDPNKKIEMHILLSKKKIDVPLKPNDEILGYRWYSIEDDDSILSLSIKNHLIPYARQQQLM